MSTCVAISNQDERVRGTTCSRRFAPLHAKNALLAYVVGVREKRREQGQNEVKRMFIDMKKAHLNACDEEE